MIFNAVLLHKADNVVTVTEPVKKGGQAAYRTENGSGQVEALEDIPIYHKIAVCDLEAGAQVVKYGQIIGAVTEPVEKGKWLSHLNIVSLPRDYNGEMAE